MNSLITIGLIGSDIKKYVTVVLGTIAVVLSLPIIAVVAMGDEVLSFLSSSPSAEYAQTQGFYMGGIIPGNTYEWGNCTYWVFAMRLWAENPIPTTWGNANAWDENALRDGYEVNQTPAVGAIMQSDRGEWGHVAYVTDINSETGQWTISEMNAPTLNVVTTRTFAASAALYYDFIHDKQGATP